MNINLRRMYEKIQVSKVRKSGIRALKLFLIFVFSLFTIHYSLSTSSYAAHPLVTDDTGTQGKGKFQVLGWSFR